MAENKFLKWMSANTPTVYWHDSAINAELEAAMENGAVGMTTNPFLVNATLQNDTEFWKQNIEAVPADITGDARAEEWICRVVSYYAKKLAPLREKGPYAGYVCAQTNPCKPGDVEATVNLARKYGACGKNVVIKMPATNAGIEAIEICAAEGLNVAATVSFTVPQVLAVGEAITRGHKKARENGIEPGLGIAVMMVGRLDDYLRDVAADTKANVSESDIISAGTASMKRAYKIFKERNLDCVLMPAGCRGAYAIADLAGAEMICSVAPGIEKALRTNEVLEERIDVDVDADVIARLQTMPEFVKAYEPDGMTRNEFITFGSCNRTLDQFVQCGWNPLKTFSF